MHKLLMSGSVLILAATSALAADLPSRNMKPIAPVSMAPSFTWTGLYVGVNAGYGWSSANDARHRGDAPTFALINAGQIPGSFSTRRNGFTGGAQAGYNYQIGQVVFGAETDINYLGTKRNTSFAGTGGVLSSFATEQNYLGTIRARLGFTPTERLLIYGTGGLAYGDTKMNALITTPATGAVRGGSTSNVNVGWTAGAGAEYAFTNNLTGKLEYLYYSLGNDRLYHGALNGAAAAASPAVGTVRGDTAGHITRIGLNYKF